ncbi:MAG: type II secretion system secretin GspD [bacterium]|nr:type II secretion system secretin GspD [bacterium]
MKKMPGTLKLTSHSFYPLAILLVLALLAGCASRGGQPVNIIEGPDGDVKKAKKEKEKTKKKKGKVVWVQRPIEQESIISAGGKKGQAFLMNFDNITIPDFVEGMMTGVFKRNYLITDAVRAMAGRFTIKMTENLKPGPAFELFKGILAMYNVSVTKRENTYIFDQVKTATVTLKGPIVYGRKAPDRFPIGPSEEVTFIVPFYNISPEAIKPIIQSQLPDHSLVFPLPDTNQLVINGNFEDVKYTLSFIDLLDRAQFKDKSILMITPEYWDIDDFEIKIRMLLLAEGVSIEAMEKTKGILFIPIEKLNSIIVISPVKEWMDRVLYWLEQLDIPEAAGESKKVYTYKLRNVEVESVSEVLQAYRTGTIPTGYGAFSGGTRGSRTGGSRAGGKTSGGKDGPGGKGAKTTGSRARTNTRRSGTMSGVMTGDEEPIDEVSIIPILETNSIVIVGTPVEYKKYLDIIKRIDVPRNQVFVEVIIGEVSLDKATQMGLEFWINRYLYRTTFGTKGGLGVFKGSDESGNAIVPSGSNFFVNGSLPGTQFEVLINALVENSKINIISTPKITVLENEEAEISVGSDVPVISSESGIAPNQTGGDGTNFIPFRSVQYINTGIILKVKAAILSDNQIALEIEQEISEALENKVSEISSPEILKRTVKTTMIVKEGEIAFIGGLFQNKISSSGSGIPILSKIPLLGNLFKNTKKQLKKTELVVFINAKTIRKSSDMRDIVEGVKKMFSDPLYIKDKLKTETKTEKNQ